MSDSSTAAAPPRGPPPSEGVVDKGNRFFIQRPAFLIIGAVWMVIFGIAVHVMRTAHLLTPLHPHHNQQCQLVGGPIGAEDVALDNNGVLLISSDARTWVPHINVDGFTDKYEARKRIAQLGPNEQGGIWAYDSRPPSESPTSGSMVRVEIDGWPDWLLDFHPHGLTVAMPDLQPDENVKDYPSFLYVLNHARGGDEVMVFEVTYPNNTRPDGTKSPVTFPPRLKFRTIMRDATHINGVNEIDAFYPIRQSDGTYLHSVYVSNFLGSAIGDGFWNLIETFLSRPWGSVVLCQGSEEAERTTMIAAPPQTRCTTVLPNQAGPNGIAIAGDRSTVYVAMTLGQTLDTFDLPPPSSGPCGPSDWCHGSLRVAPLTLVESYPMYSAVDNLFLDHLTGDVFIGAHPKPLQFTRHHDDNTQISPSQAIRFTPREPKLSRHAAAIQERVRRHELSIVELVNPAVSRAARGGRSIPTPRVDEIFLDSGGGFSASSVAVWNRATNELILGAVAIEGIYVCTYPNPDQRKSTETSQSEP